MKLELPPRQETNQISSVRQPTRVLRIGVPDRFSEHCGTHAYLLREHGLDTVSLGQRVSAFCHTLSLNSEAISEK